MSEEREHPLTRVSRLQATGQRFDAFAEPTKFKKGDRVRFAGYRRGMDGKTGTVIGIREGGRYYTVKVDGAVRGTRGESMDVEADWLERA